MNTNMAPVLKGFTGLQNHFPYGKMRRQSLRSHSGGGRNKYRGKNPHRSLQESPIGLMTQFPS